MIVHAIEENLGNGLQKNGQVVVSLVMLPIRLFKLIPFSLCVSHTPPMSINLELSHVFSSDLCLWRMCNFLGVLRFLLIYLIVHSGPPVTKSEISSLSTLVVPTFEFVSSLF